MARAFNFEYDWVTDPQMEKYFSLSLIPTSLLSRLLNNSPGEVINNKTVSYKLVETNSKQILISYNEVNELINQEIINIYSTLIISGVRKSLVNGLQQHNYKIKSSNDISLDQHFKLLSWINLIEYPLLILTLSANKLPSLDSIYNDNATVAEIDRLEAKAWKGLLDIIKNVVSDKINIVIRTVLHYTIRCDPDKIYNFYFIDDHNRSVYASPETLDLLQLIPFDQYYGWRYLSDDPLTLYALNDLDVPVTIVDNIYLIPILNTYDDIINDLYLKLRSLNNQGYLTLTDGSDQLLTLYSEIIQRFGHEIKTFTVYYSFHLDQRTKAIYLQNNRSQKIKIKDDSLITLTGPLVFKARANCYSIANLSAWIRESASLIRHNQLPQVNLRGLWQDLFHQFIDESKARIYHLVYMAFKQVVQQYSYLLSQIYTIKVEDDLSVTMALSSWSEEQTMIKAMEDIISIDNPKNWPVFTAEDLDDLVIKRWVLRKKFPQVRTFGLIIQNKFFIVGDQHIEPMLLSKFPWDPDRSELEKELAQVFNFLNGQLITNESVIGNVPPLSYYLDHVPVLDLGPAPYLAQNRKIYLINRDQSLRSFDVFSPGATLTDQPFIANPTTGNLISLDSLSRLIFYPQAWMGLFDVAKPLTNLEDICQRNVACLVGEKTPAHQLEKNSYLPGLFHQPPYRYLVKPPPGQIIVRGFLPASTARDEFIITVSLEIDPQDYFCLNKSLIFDGSTKENINLLTEQNINKYQYLIVPLFDLSYHRIPDDQLGMANTLSNSEKNFIEQISQVTEWLWNHGWFLSYWATAILTETKKISCSTINYTIHLDYFLRSADLNPTFGERAVKYLNAMASLVN